MHKNTFFYSLILTSFFTFLSPSLWAWNCNYSCDAPWGVTAEARVAYYHPSSKKVRRIYGDGWADYQLEISKKFKGFRELFGEDYRQSWANAQPGNEIDWTIWAGISGFSKKGKSIGFHDRTRLQLLPINLGVKFFYPVFCNTKIFVGGAACYSLLRIKDHSPYVHRHTHRQAWGGLVQSGLSYDFRGWGTLTAFFDYFFQRFHFHHKRHHAFHPGDHFYSSRHPERHNLNLNGYKVGIGLGVVF